MFCFL